MTEAEFQHIGDRLTQALVVGDFALYQSVMRLPLHISPQGGEPYTLRTEPELKADFELYRLAVKARHITDIYRKVLRIEMDQTDTVRVLCEMNILAHANRVVEPFQSQFTLARKDDGWRIVDIASPLAHISWTQGKYIITPDAKFSPRSNDDAAT